MGTGTLWGWEQTLCVKVNGLIQSSYFLVTISALTEQDWIVFQGNHAFLV